MYTERTIIHEPPSKLNPIDRNQLTATEPPLLSSEHDEKKKKSLCLIPSL